VTYQQWVVSDLGSMESGISQHVVAFGMRLYSHE
jgi:hypothetical protein